MKLKTKIAVSLLSVLCLLFWVGGGTTEKSYAANSGEWVSVGNGRIRIDPPHISNANQQVHAHCQSKSRKQEIVVNKVGTQSHDSGGKIIELTRIEKEYLRSKGFNL